jgi:hypothetical protein
VDESSDVVGGLGVVLVGSVAGAVGREGVVSEVPV